ncbi:energy transducer TonB [Rhodoferax lacus]|uniref:Energy transducer TonB n=2 Tax=Rhodoferax lacus TaxID=2184758 RepID=A0A3E1RGE5_9BURK|nr:energy transducer TonB [Rhodoferax lacus]
MQSFTPPEPANALMVELFQDPVTAPKSPVLSPSRPVAEPARPQQTQNRQQPKVAQPLLASESAQAAPSFEAAKPEKATPAVATSAVATQASTAPAATPATAPAAATTAPRFDAAYLDNPAPVYPPLSRRAGEEGRVLLHVLVEASGVAAQVEVRSSSGFERLDRAAMAAVRRWKFVPAKQGAEAVAAWVLVPIVFGLKG